MKIPIISDTHDDVVNTKRVLEEIKNKGFEELIHLGDYSAPFMIDYFKGLKVHTVLGNNDGDKYRIISKMIDNSFNFKDYLLELEIEGKKLALYHGTEEGIINALILCKKYDVVLHGHTHKIRNEVVDGVLVLNPGAVNKNISKDKVSSYMIVDFKTLEVEVFKN
ncbi:MAG: metallophosphoesterase family protein [Candidatus Woesearchaeota archaeon]